MSPVPKSLVIYLVHIWGHGPEVMGAVKAKALLKKHGGEYYWLGKTCHVYLRPATEVKLSKPSIKGVTT